MTATIGNLKDVLDKGNKAAWFEYVPWLDVDGQPNDDFKPNCCAPLEVKISTMSRSAVMQMLQSTGYKSGINYDREKYHRIMAGKIVEWRMSWGQFKTLVSVDVAKIDAYPDETVIECTPENKQTALAEIKGFADWLLRKCQEFAEFDAKLKEGQEKNS